MENPIIGASNGSWAIAWTRRVTCSPPGQHGSYGSGGKWDLDDLDGVPGPQFLLRGWLERIRDFLDHWQVILGMVTLAGMILVVVVALVWISSRAKFIFLENVTKKHALFVDP